MIADDQFNRRTVRTILLLQIVGVDVVAGGTHHVIFRDVGREAFVERLSVSERVVEDDVKLLLEFLKHRCIDGPAGRRLEPQVERPPSSFSRTSAACPSLDSGRSRKRRRNLARS